MSYLYDRHSIRKPEQYSVYLSLQTDFFDRL